MTTPGKKAAKTVGDKEVLEGKVRHTVKATIKNVELVKAGSSIALELFDDGKKIGTLDVGRGSFIWKGPGRRKSYQMTWAEFAANMNRIAYNE